MNPSGLTDVRVLGLIEAIRHVPAAVAVVDASGQIVHVNERAMELTERQLGESMPEDLGGAIDIFHLDGRRYERDEWPVVRSITSGEEVVDEEYFYVLPAGGRLVVRGTSSAVYDEEGTIVAGVLVMVDITAEKQLAEPLSCFDRLLENTDDAIVGTDADFRLNEQRRREQEHDDRQAMDSLTAREREVLQALADGLDSQAAADRLHITLRTERNHVANILAKLRVHSRLQALVLCLRYGVVEIR